jgi:RNA polymerase-binding transcription factor DksA
MVEPNRPENLDTPRQWKNAERQLRADREKCVSELGEDLVLRDKLAQGWQDRDSACESEIRDVEFAYRGAIRERIFQIDQALDRIKAGTYGRCMACGHIIDRKRLANELDAPFCIVCQRALEGEAAAST